VWARCNWPSKKLKQKLQAEGLFAPERKRPLPRYPQRLGLVTSPTGAAIRDVLHVIERRQPGLEIVLAPCRVQGQGRPRRSPLRSACLTMEAPRRRPAGPAACRPRSAKLDLILVTRAAAVWRTCGRSTKNGWRAPIFESEIPVISAVGHEMILPSATLSPTRGRHSQRRGGESSRGAFSSRAFVADSAQYLGKLVRQRLRPGGGCGAATGATPCPRPPASIAQRGNCNCWMICRTSLVRCVRSGLRQQRTAWRTVQEAIVPIEAVRCSCSRAGQSLRDLERRCASTSLQCKEARNVLAGFGSRLRLLSPETRWGRGYSSRWMPAPAESFAPPGRCARGQRLRTKLKSGEITSVAQK